MIMMKGNGYDEDEDEDEDDDDEEEEEKSQKIEIIRMGLQLMRMVGDDEIDDGRNVMIMMTMGMR